VGEVLGKWEALLAKVPEPRRGELVRSMGLKMVRPIKRRREGGAVAALASAPVLTLLLLTPTRHPPPLLHPPPKKLQEQLKAELKELDELHA
jgi:hypothetical protein